MGRELKRVPMDFDHPIGEVWGGYINPHSSTTQCPICKGTGRSAEAEFWHSKWYGYIDFDPAETGSQPFTPNHPIVRALAERNCSRVDPMFFEGAVQREGERLCGFFNKAWQHHLSQDDVDALIEAGRLWDFTRAGIEHPTAAQVNEWSLQGWGHDSINSWVCIRRRCAKNGAHTDCPECGGEGWLWETPEAKALHDYWKPEEPPQGEGWQVWENVSDGSPISPVFPDADALIAWLIDQGYSEGAAEAFAREGYAASMMVANGRVYKDIEGLNAAGQGE